MKDYIVDISSKRRLPNSQNDFSHSNHQAHFAHLGKHWLLKALLFLAVLCAGKLLFSPSLKIDSSKWQAVFLTNGQVYFGHMKHLGSGFVKVSPAYYLRTADNLQNGDKSQPALGLVKLGNEIHSPEEEVFVSLEQIVFWEYLNPESQVVSL